MALLEVISVSKAFGGVPVLSSEGGGVSFRVEEGEIVCLLGPSGCGKTTLLRTVAGLETPDSGQILCDGANMAGVPVHRRGFGLMFQDYALFPHRDVADNVAFGLRMLGLSAAEVRSSVAGMLKLVGLEGYEQRKVYELSGGEQQRVALARSLAPRPRLLMLDEPLGSLDRALREELMNELRAILRRVARPVPPALPGAGPQRQKGVTALYVTHDQQEAFAVADRVILLDRGRVVQEGSPQEVYRRPANPWVARFLGMANLIPGRVLSAGTVVVETALGPFTIAQEGGWIAGQAVTVVIRPEAARMATIPEAASFQDGDSAGVGVEAVVEDCSFRGSRVRLSVRHASGLELTFDLVPSGTSLPPIGQRIVLILRPEAIGLLDGETP